MHELHRSVQERREPEDATHQAPRSEPPISPAALVQRLSATAGNQAVARMLGGSAPRMLSRYGVNDAVDALTSETTKVGKSGTGNTGALWIQNAGGTRLWIKAQAVPAQRQVFAQEVLERVGVATPGTRVLTPDEAKELYGKVLMDGSTDVAGKAFDWLAAADSSHHLLMANAPGTTPGRAAEKIEEATTPGSEKTALNDRFVRAFKDPAFAKSVGRMIAADEFTGNADRISEQGAVETGYEDWLIHAHPNNFMVEEDAGRFVLTAIDNDAVLEYADDYGTKNLEQLVTDISEGILVNAPRGGGKTSLVFAAGVEGLFDQARTTRMIDHMLRTYRDLAGGELFAGFTDTDAATFRTQCLAGWTEARAIIMRDLSKIKRRFDALYGEAGGTKNDPTEVEAFEESSFRARKVYSQMRAEVDAAQAYQHTRRYLKEKYIGKRNPFVDAVEEAFADPSADDPRVAQRVGKLNALTDGLKDAAAEVFALDAPATTKFERLQVKKFIAAYPASELESKLAAFLPKAGTDVARILELREAVEDLKAAIAAADTQHIVRFADRIFV